ncbi:MAG: hypothetical protein VX154_06505 [Pseudomonadota bacterium]|nr:hypothetical protein [Pseudomonadota bacterium]
MLWLAPALATLLAQVTVANWNRARKHHPITLNFWRCIPALLCFSPALFISNWPQQASFYYASILIGVVSAAHTITIFYLAAQFNGRISSISTNFTMLLSYIAWLLIDPAEQQKFLSNPWQSSLISLCIFTAFASTFFMRSHKKDGQKGYLGISILMGVILTACTIVGKQILDNDASKALQDQVLILGFIIFCTQLLGTGLILAIRHAKAPSHSVQHTPVHLKTFSVWVLGLFGALGCVTSWAAIALAPNPAYVNAVCMSAPILFLFYHKMVGVEDKANPIAGTIFTLCVVTIILLEVF